MVSEVIGFYKRGLSGRERVVLHMKGCLIQRHGGHCVTWTFLEEATSENDKVYLFYQNDSTKMIGKKNLIQPSPVFYIYPLLLLLFFVVFFSEDLIYKEL